MLWPHMARGVCISYVGTVIYACVYVFVYYARLLDNHRLSALSIPNVIIIESHART